MKLQNYEYYRSDNGILYCGDSRKILPMLSCNNVCITDPVWPNCPRGLFSGWQNPKKLFRQVVSLINVKRLVVILRSDSDPRFLSCIPKGKYPFFKVQILPYAIPYYIGRKLGGDEIVYTFGSPVPSSPGRRVIPTYAPKIRPQDDDFSAMNQRKKLLTCHMWSRVTEHMRWLIKWWTEKGEKVVDPFFGTGTTGVACESMSCQWVGIEINEKTCEVAKRRIQAENDQMKLAI